MRSVVLAALAASAAAAAPSYVLDAGVGGREGTTPHPRMRRAHVHTALRRNAPPQTNTL